MDPTGCWTGQRVDGTLPFQVWKYTGISEHQQRSTTVIVGETLAS